MPDWGLLETKLIGGLLLVAAAINGLFALRHLVFREPMLSAHFSPNGGCQAAIVAEIGRARSEILVQAYSFSCPDIAQALIQAAARRVRVVVLLDRSNEAESYSELGDLEKHGLEVMIDGHHAIAHNKVMVIDGRTILTGSFNFTRQAERENAENLLVLKDHRELATRYRANFHSHREHCYAPGTSKRAPVPQRSSHGHAATHAT